MPVKKTSLSIAVMSGPNLNLLGSREKSIYGSDTLESIHRQLQKLSQELGVKITCEQTNSEGEMVNLIQSHRDKNGFIINAAAYTHTSIAIRDALKATEVPFVEVHLSNIFSREEFRQKSFLSDIALGVISGFGAQSYLLGLRGLVSRLK